MKIKIILFGIILVFIACSSEDDRNNNEQSEVKDAVEKARTTRKNVTQSEYDFNNDGVNDGITQVSVNKEGNMRVINVYIKGDSGYFPTYDQYDNEMIYPGDSIAPVQDGHFKFMYHNGDYFVFDFVKEEGKWTAQQVQ